MSEQRPQELGVLLQVVPVIQTRSNGPWTVVLVSLERWDRCFVANVDLQQEGPIERGARRLHPRLDLDALVDGGGWRNGQFGGGYGGGSRDEGRHHRLIYKFAPPLDPAARQIRLIAQLRLVEQGDDFPPRDIIVQTEPGPWTFTAELPPWRSH